MTATRRATRGTTSGTTREAIHQATCAPIPRIALLSALPIAAALALGPSCAARAQSAADGAVLTARRVDDSASFKIFNARGSVRVVGWEHDSLLVRGRLARPGSFGISGDARGMKLVIDDDSGRGGAGPRPAQLVIYLPRHARASIRAVNADVDLVDAGGWIYTITGTVHVSGTAGPIEIESMRGPVEVDARTPWLRVRGGDGAVVVRGAPQDADVSTIAGPLDVAADGIVRGQFGSVSGDVRYTGTPVPGGIYDFSNHSGAIDLRLPADASAALALSNVMGPIENGFTRVRPLASAPNTMRLTLGAGEAQVMARSFRGAIRVRPR